MRTLEGQTALVTGGGGPLGRAIALALAARGVRIVVTGRDEKALGITVGEVVHGGGKARHLAGDPEDASHVTAALHRALEVFGGVELVVHAADTGAECTFSVAAPRLGTLGRIVAVGIGATGASTAAAALARERWAELFARRITVNAVLVDGAPADDVLDDLAPDLASLVVFLCGATADRITGQAITITSRGGG